MIKFLQDYTTKSLPPETFEADQEVERSPESEMYFVRLGVAGFLVDGVVVDEDYRPIVRTPLVLAVVGTDRRFTDTGRGGEVIGLDTPQRASSGPGNATVFAGQPDNIGLGTVEVEQLRGDLAQALEGQRADADRIAGLAGGMSAIESERDGLRDELTAARAALAEAQRANEAAGNDLTGLRLELTAAQTALAEANRETEAAGNELSELRTELAAANDRIAVLDAQIAEASQAEDRSAPAPSAARRK